MVEGRGLPAGGLPGLIAGHRLLTGTEDTLRICELPSGEPVGGLKEWVRRGCTGTRASTNLPTTRYRSNSAWVDLATREITPFLGVRSACTVNNNLYPGIVGYKGSCGGLKRSLDHGRFMVQCSRNLQERERIRSDE